MDYVDLVVHIFTKEKRRFYRLEKLWSDAPRLALDGKAAG
jgi:ribosome-associated protein